MDDLDALLEARAADDGGDIDALLESRAATDSATAVPAKAPAEADRKAVADYFKPRELPWYERAARGAVDPVLGLGQIVQNAVPDAVLNAGRKVTDPLLNAVLPGKDQDTSSTSTDEFNSMVRRDEGAYQGKRADAGQSGIDFARVGGTIANPLSWIAPEGAASSTVLQALAAGVKAGAFQALLQPVVSEGSFIWDKATQAALGGAFGGTLGGTMGALRPVFSRAREVFGRVFNSADARAQAQAASQITDDALRAAQVDPARVDPVIVSSMKQEVQDALKVGVDPDPTVMTNRADAAALPVPVNLTRGMASRDPFQYSWEVNTSKRTGIGEPLSETISNANRNLIANLDELGAKGALSPYDFSQQAIQHLETIDDGLRQAINGAYAGVRNSAGQSALLNHQQFVDTAFRQLRQQGLGDVLPEEVKATLNALQLGRSPLTVEMAQSLDKVWTGLQGGLNESKSRAIETVKKALFNTDVGEQVGQASMAAYRQAKDLAKQRFDLIDKNPALKAVVDKLAEPDKFFQKYLAGANVSSISELKQLLGADLTKAAQGTAVRGLKKAAIGNSSPENATFSQANYNNSIHNDVTAPRLRELFKDSPEVLSQLYRVGRVAESVFKYPGGHSVNTSNTATAGANMIEEALRGTVGRNPVVGLVQFGRDYAARKAEERTIAEASRAGVTKGPLRPAPPSRKTARISDLLSRGAGALAPQNEE